MSCFTSSFSLSPSLSIQLSFFHLFCSHFLLCKTDRSRAGFKVNGKAIFSPAHFAVHACHSRASSCSPFPLSLSSSFSPPPLSPYTPLVVRSSLFGGTDTVQSRYDTRLRCVDKSLWNSLTDAAIKALKLQPERGANIRPSLSASLV